MSRTLLLLPVLAACGGDRVILSGEAFGPVQSAVAQTFLGVPSAVVTTVPDLCATLTPTEEQIELNAKIGAWLQDWDPADCEALRTTVARLGELSPYTAGDAAVALYGSTSDVTDAADLEGQLLLYRRPPMDAVADALATCPETSDDIEVAMLAWMTDAVDVFGITVVQGALTREGDDLVVDVAEATATPAYGDGEPLTLSVRATASPCPAP